MKKYRVATYTQEEINSALSRLDKELNRKLDERKELNKDIRAIKQNIDYYNDLDLSQTRLGI